MQEAGRGGRAEAQPHGDDCRCLCGNLLARVVGDRVELKCRRCKRTHSIPLAGGRRAAPAGGALAPLRKASAP
jgi:hypothetical protein